MNNLCYESYEKKNNKREVIKKGEYLLKSNCCDRKSCEELSDDIQDTKYKCNDIFSEIHDLDEKGNIIGDTLCSELNKKQNIIHNQKLLFFNKFRKGGKSKKRKKKKEKRKKRKTLRKEV
jgi:hypothetical protein